MARYIYNGDISAQQVFDVNERQDIISSSVLNSILKNTEPDTSVRYAPTNIARDMTVAYNFNYSQKVDKYYKYGVQHHSDSIPTNFTETYTLLEPVEDISYNDPHPDIQTIIEDLIGEPITIQWYYFGRPNLTLVANNFFVKSPLFKIHGRNVVTNSVVKFVDVTTNTVYFPERHKLIGSTLTIFARKTIWFEPPGPNPEDSRWVKIGPEVSFITDLATSPDPIEAFDILHQVVYSTNSTNDFGAWFYNEVDNLHPTIHGSAPVPDDEGGSYPFTMLIENGKFVSKGEMGPEYKAETEGILKTIDLDLDQVMTSLEDPSDPDALKDVKDAFLLYAINIDNDTDGTLQYMYEHFRQYYTVNNRQNDNLHENWSDNYLTDPSTNNYLSAMHFYNNRVKFDMYLRWVRLTIKTGNVESSFPTPPNTELAQLHPFVSEIDANNTGNTKKVNGVTIGKITKQVIIGTEYATTEIQPYPVNDHMLILRKQLTETTYVEMVIMGLSHFTHITGFSTTGGSTKGFVLSINTLEHLENGKMFMPLSFDIMNQFNPILRSTIFYESLTIALHLFSRIKLPWYTNPALWIIIRIILIIITWGSSELWVEGVIAVIQAIAINYAIQVIVTEILMLLVDAIGGKAALIIAAIAATYALLRGGSSSTDGLFSLLNADQLLQSATLLVHSVNETTKEDFLTLEHDFETHQDFVGDQKEILEDMQALISKGVTLDLATSITRQPLMDLYEKPRDFYNRSIHLTNPGVLSLDTIDSYVKNLLVLPTYEDN